MVRLAPEDRINSAWTCHIVTDMCYALRAQYMLCDVLFVEHFAMCVPVFLGVSMFSPAFLSTIVSLAVLVRRHDRLRFLVQIF